MVLVRLSAKAIEQARNLGGGNISKGVRMAVELAATAQEA
jgi:hypothetical protein